MNTSLGRSILRAVNEQSFLSKKVYITYLNLIIIYKNFRLLIFATFKKQLIIKDELSKTINIKYKIYFDSAISTTIKYLTYNCVVCNLIYALLNIML